MLEMHNGAQPASFGHFWCPLFSVLDCPLCLTFLRDRSKNKKTLQIWGPNNHSWGAPKIAELTGDVAFHCVSALEYQER